MQKKHIVRLLPEERQHLSEVIKKLKGSGQKVRRAYILQKADADGPNWRDQQIAEAFSCRIKTKKRNDSAQNSLLGHSSKQRC